MAAAIVLSWFAKKHQCRQQVVKLKDLVGMFNFSATLAHEPTIAYSDAALLSIAAAPSGIAVEKDPKEKASESRCYQTTNNH